MPFTYVSSFLFTSESEAQTITIFVHFVFAGIGSIAALTLRVLDQTKNLGDQLNQGLKVLPSFCLTNSLMFEASRDRLFDKRPELSRDSDLDVSLMGGDIQALLLHFGAGLLLLAFIEAGVLSWLLKFPLLLPKNRIPPKHDLILDEDVKQEDDRVGTEITQNN